MVHQDRPSSPTWPAQPATATLRRLPPLAPKQLRARRAGEPCQLLLACLATPSSPWSPSATPRHPRPPLTPSLSAPLSPAALSLAAPSTPLAAVNRICSHRARLASSSRPSPLLPRAAPLRRISRARRHRSNAIAIFFTAGRRTSPSSIGCSQAVPEPPVLISRTAVRSSSFSPSFSARSRAVAAFPASTELRPSPLPVDLASRRSSARSSSPRVLPRSPGSRRAPRLSG